MLSELSPVHDLFGHSVDECYVAIDELCHVLVAGRNEYVQAIFASLLAKRADNVIGFHPLDAQ